MKFEAAAITPGFAKVCQKGTEPSAKSIQSVPRPGIPHAPASARCGAAANAAQAQRAMTSSLLTDPRLKLAGREAKHPPPALRICLFVERGIDLGHFLGLGRLVRLALVVRFRLAAEIEAQARQVETVAAVGADLLERREQLLALVGLLRHLLGRPDVD